MAEVEHSITVALNGREVATRAETLAFLLAEQGFDRGKVATALNEEFVPERARDSTALRHGDRVEVVSVRQGG